MFICIGVLIRVYDTPRVPAFRDMTGLNKIVPDPVRYPIQLFYKFLAKHTEHRSFLFTPEISPLHAGSGDIFFQSLHI